MFQTSQYSYPSYEFAYKVDDPYTGDKKGQEETRDGDEVKGEYWLMQPDGRKRIVKYHADKKSGSVNINFKLNYLCSILSQLMYYFIKLTFLMFYSKFTYT